MKLWKKISLVCIAVLATVAMVMGAVLLVDSAERMIALAKSAAAAKQEALATSFAEMAGYYIDDGDAPVVRDSVVKYCFAHFADETSVLMRGTETVYSQVTVNPDEYLCAVETQQNGIFDISDMKVLIVGSTVAVRGQMYAVYHVEDISAIYSDIKGMIGRYAVVSGVCVLVGMTAIILLVRRSMRPLVKLGTVAEKIASGSYKERINVDSRDEVGKLAEDFNAMTAAVERHVQELEERAERQRIFIGGVSHEFKTPIAAMMLGADTLQNAYLGDDERARVLMHMKEHCRWMESMTQKLLRLITARESVDAKETNVAQLFEKVNERTKGMMRDRGITLVCECGDECISLDEDMMLSALVNLVDNAAKASQSGQTIYLRAYDNVIEVADEGCGMAEEHINRIFEPFYMADKSRSKRMGGSGLGLALVSEMAAGHGAEIDVKSGLGQGTRVRMIFKQ